MLKKLLSLLTGQGAAGEVVVVSGLPRSGTSLMMQMLDAGGLAPLTDGQRTGDEDNPKGYYEFERVKKLKSGDTGWVADAVGRAVKVVSAHLAHLPGGYHYRVVFMDRDLDEVLASQRKMLDHRGEEERVEHAEMKRMFRRHLRQVREWMAAQPNFEALEVRFDQVIQSPEAAVRELCEFLGRDLDRRKMAEVVDPDLYRNRATDTEEPATVN